MRTNGFIDREDVVAVVLGDVSSQITFSCAEVKKAIKVGGGGGWILQEDITKDFFQMLSSLGVG